MMIERRKSKVHAHEKKIVFKNSSIVHVLYRYKNLKNLNVSVLSMRSLFIDFSEEPSCSTVDICFLFNDHVCFIDFRIYVLIKAGCKLLSAINWYVLKISNIYNRIANIKLIRRKRTHVNL